MFERYTEKARRVIFFGRYEASHYGSPEIDTEHLLLGIFREGALRQILAAAGFHFLLLFRYYLGRSNFILPAALLGDIPLFPARAALTAGHTLAATRPSHYVLGKN